MSNAIAWLVFFLGVVHIAYGVLKYRAPLAEVMAAGFIDQFRLSDLRRTAFWFIAFGPLLMLAGHVAIRAVANGDLGLLKIIGGYALFTSLLGVAAFPRSPFPVSLIVSVLLLAAGYGWLP
jgi:hypothetical protein